MKTFKIALVLMTLLFLAVGSQQAAKKPGGNCPSGGGCGCSTAYAPVICSGHCRYTNMCHARCAGFDSTQCKDALN